MSHNYKECGGGSNQNSSPCGCKTSTDKIAYQGPSLECLGIGNCASINDILLALNNLICSPEMIQIIINNILSNEELNQEFIEIINASIGCDTILQCFIEGTTTTINPDDTTTSTTTLPITCKYLKLTSSGDDAPWSGKMCDEDGTEVSGIVNFGQEVYTPCIDVDSFNGDEKITIDDVFDCGCKNVRIENISGNANWRARTCEGESISGIIIGNDIVTLNCVNMDSLDLSPTIQIINVENC